MALFAAFRRRETALGRFAPLPPRAAIDAAWLEENVLAMLPEEAGALWDESIGAPEVAAVIARLAAENKIEARAEGKKLILKQARPDRPVLGLREDLIQALFFDGDETDTDEIRKHYRGTGFDPAERSGKGSKKSSRSTRTRRTAPGVRGGRRPPSSFWPGRGSSSSSP